MKKFFLSALFSLFIINSEAQIFPFWEVTDIPYYWSPHNHNRVMIQDSSLYEGRRCLQIKNIVSGQTEYRWANHAQLYMLLPDKHGNYIFLKDNSFIGVYDTILQDYVNINTGPLANITITSIGLSPNGNIWAAGYQQLGLYNGSTWQVYPYYGYREIKVIDDSSAYLTGNPFLKFHNGTFDTLFYLPTNVYFRDWDIDSLGNLWIAGTNKLIYAHDTTMVFFDSTNTPVGSEKFSKVVVGKNGHVWTCGAKQNLFEYDGTSWTTHALPSNNIYIDNFNLDSLSRPWVIGGDLFNNQFSNMNIYVWNGSNFNSPIDFKFNPYRNIKAISPNSLANDDGVFSFNPANYQISSFVGIPEHIEATQVNCFMTYSQYNSSNYFPYGTNSGVYTQYGQVPGLDTTVLPNDTVNCIVNDNGSQYVCTNNGMLVYSGVFYNTLNTTNSPLPSDTITFATVVQNQPYNKLYIGTANGIAIYSNSQWTIFDAAYFGLNTCYVTGILIQPWDTIAYVTTMGNGLIKLYPSGTFDLLNVSNGGLQDDSLYYASLAELAKCGAYIVIGTKHNGIAVYEFWSNSFQYYNASNGYPFTESRAAINNNYYFGNFLLGTNTGLYWASPCGSVQENNIYGNLNVYPNPSTGLFSVEQPFMSHIEVLNTLGEIIFQKETKVDKLSINLSNLTKGIYFIRTTDKNQKVFNRKIILY